MSSDVTFTKDNLDTYLKELGKEFRRLNGTKMPAEIILVGGAAVLTNYGFREKTYDVDAVILASSVMKEAINNTGDRLGLPNGWLNTDFTQTKSFSEKLLQVSKYYRTYSNILTIRTIAGEYLIAMKLMSGRRYKNDLSDIAGILWEHQKHGVPIKSESIDNAIMTLYGNSATLPDNSKILIDTTLENGDYEMLYNKYSEAEKQAKDILQDFEKTHPGELKGENINNIIDQARNKSV